MKNLIVDDSPRDFFVWVNPNNRLVRHHVGLLGCFFSTPAEPGQPMLMFIPNPAFQSALSPFQNNLIREYTVEYNLEINREALFPSYPSRLRAIFLLESEEEARKYARLHPGHVEGRTLLRGTTSGPYRYSIHDASWIDFMREAHSMDQDTLGRLVDAYWTGARVEDCELQSMGQPWPQETVREVLFEGRINFPPGSLSG